MKIKLIIYLLPISMIGAYAQEANLELKKYARCYGQFVRERIPVNDARLSAIRAGSMTGLEACEELLNTATLNGGYLASNNQTYADEAIKVLRTFHHYHSSWFSTNNGYENMLVQWEFFDHDEPALYYTKSLFDPSFSIRGVLTGEIQLKGRRRTSYQGLSTDVLGISWLNFNGFYLQSVANNVLYRAEKGELIGITPFEGNLELTGPVPGNINYARGLPYKHLGGGVLGGNGYTIRSVDIDKSTRYDQGINVNRRWSRRVFNDFLCRDVPVIRISDAVSEVIDSSLPTELSFRRSAVCMQCHSSMDPMARVFRNRAVFATGMGNSVGVFEHDNVSQILQHMPTQNPSFDIDDHRNAYMDQANWYSGNTRYLATLGVFRFRNMEGQLIAQDVDNLEELGSALTSTPDFYACAVKRYLHFLTGIKVEIEDPVNVSRNSVQNQHYAFVLRLANGLREHQNPMRTIVEIMSSPYYMNPYYLE